jgi:hypothetical protein
MFQLRPSACRQKITDSNRRSQVIQNAFVENFNGRVFNELLNETLLFLRLDDATAKVAVGRRLPQRLVASIPRWLPHACGLRHTFIVPADWLRNLDQLRRSPNA